MLQLIYSNAQLFVTLLFSSFDKVSKNFVANAVTFVLGFNSVLGVPSRLVVVDFPVDYEKVYVNLRKANLYPTLGDAMVPVMCEK